MNDASLMLVSFAAGAGLIVAALLTRNWLGGRSGGRALPDRSTSVAALRTFGGRMSRDVPMDELLQQLVESLHSSYGLQVAEIWTRADSRLLRTVSRPDQGAGTVPLTEQEIHAIARAGAQGRAWLRVWTPGLLAGRDPGPIRCVPIAHLGNLLGVILVERPAGMVEFTDQDDQALVDLARQLGLALHNMRLDFALAESLEELRIRNQELSASRARIVTAADESRRRIERDLHDGAQQQLVALAVKVGLLKTLLTADPDAGMALVDELRVDVQSALAQLRELAHGIYPPLLAERGLAEALQAALHRSELPSSLRADGIYRYSPEIESAVYFCCLEALQNARKHAGPAATISVELTAAGERLTFEVCDTGPGFDPGHAAGQGFTNMRDRLGAFSGVLTVRSSPGSGCTVRGDVPIAAPVTVAP